MTDLLSQINQYVKKKGQDVNRADPEEVLEARTQVKSRYENAFVTVLTQNDKKASSPKKAVDPLLSPSDKST